MGECKFVNSPKFGKVSLNLFLIRAVLRSAKFTSQGNTTPQRCKEGRQIM
jgi:hypothetical protein